MIDLRESKQSDAKNDSAYEVRQRRNCNPGRITNLHMSIGHKIEVCQLVLNSHYIGMCVRYTI